MPNFRAVSAGVRPPPPTPRQASRIATLNSFDYSSFGVAGVTSLLSEGTIGHPPLGNKCPDWAAITVVSVDKSDGNYLVVGAAHNLSSG